MKRALPIVLCIILFAAAAASSSPFEETITVLERWTSFHWGRDCLVWVVHYPSELVEPWVESEALKARLSELQKEEYRKSFETELRMNDTEPFLVSIYAFGSSPLSLKPFGDMITLLRADGTRVKALSYDRVFDDSITGIVQGLVYFPKQNSKDFSLAIKGLGIYSESVFSFAGQPEFSGAPTPAAKDDADEMIVIDIAKAPPKEEPKKPAPPVVVIEEKPKETPKEEPKEEPAPVPPVAVANKENIYQSRETVLNAFIGSWKSSDTKAMYDMLSAETKKMYTLDTFEKEIKKLSDFRRGLMSGYKINWVGDERAKIITTKRLLVMRTLISRTLGVRREDRDWRIVW